MSKIVHIILVTVVAYGSVGADTKFEPVIPEECKGQEYCLAEDIPYPSEYVEELLPTIQDLVKTFTVKDLTKGQTRRLGPDVEIPLCPTRQQVVYPRVAPDENLKWWFVINHGPIEQGWRVELCQYPKTECSKVAVIDRDHKGICTQQAIRQTVQALDQDGKVVSKELYIPFTCYCKITPVS